MKYLVYNMYCGVTDREATHNRSPELDARAHIHYQI